MQPFLTAFFFIIFLLECLFLASRGDVGSMNHDVFNPLLRQRIVGGESAEAGFVG